MRDISARSTLLYPGSICPPAADFADPLDRVNVVLFWHMAHLLQSLTSVLQEHDSTLAHIHDSSIIDHMQTSYAPSNIHNSPIFEALMRVCERAGPEDDENS